ncbi:MAG: serine/threonine protein kinase [Nitrososphaeraceae archaeon]
MKRRISSGSFGTIFEVQSEDDGRIYAMKELTNIDTLTKQRFEKEITALSELDHPNIVKIIQWNVGGDPPDFLPYFVMEYLRGGSLRNLMDEKFSGNNQYYFDARWTLNRIILPACNALAQAHSSNIYHRDLKPSNIMFTDSTRSSIKITDWGLVKIIDPTKSREESRDYVSSSAAAAVDVDRKSLELTAVVGEGSIGGTPDYCSPEQWFASAQKNSETVDGRTDIFSLGIIFYEMLTRRRPKPYDPNNPKLARSPIDIPSWISPQLRQSIAKMIELEPNNRQHSIWDLISEIEIAPENSL